MDHEAMKADPFLQQVFGDNLPLLLEALIVCELSYDHHDDDEDGPYRGVVNLKVDILAGILGCSREDVLPRAIECELALQEAYGLPLWRKGGKASAARARGWLRVSRTIETMSRWGGPLRESWNDFPAGLLGSVPDLACDIDEIAEAARAGATRHFLYRVAGRGPGGDDWIDYLALSAEIRTRHEKLDVRCMWEEMRGNKHLRRPGYVALSSAMVGSPHAVRLLPSVAPLLGGDHDLCDWINDGTSHRLPPTADGEGRADAIVRFHRTFRELRGVHVWCCPAKTEALVGWVPGSGPAFLPGLETFEGRQAVFLPTYTAQAALEANEGHWSRSQIDQYKRDFDVLTRLIYKGEV